MKLKQTWWHKLFNAFGGSVEDDPVNGVPGLGSIKGVIYENRIEFTKKPPVFHAWMDDRLMTIHECLAKQGQPLNHSVPHPTIDYTGTLVADDQLNGTWKIEARQLQLIPGMWMDMPGGTGTWSTMRMRL